MSNSNQLHSPYRSIATALVKLAPLRASYGPYNAKLPLFSLRHISNWIFS
jgi:hypothetical protein